MEKKYLELLSMSEEILEKVTLVLKRKKNTDADPDTKWFNDNQFLVHGLAWLATYVEALKQLNSWAENLYKRCTV